MAAREQPRITTDELHGRTAALARAAGEAGDDFLKYLYVMALRHIEEEAGSVHERQRTSAPTDG